MNLADWYIDNSLIFFQILSVELWNQSTHVVLGFCFRPDKDYGQISFHWPGEDIYELYWLTIPNSLTKASSLVCTCRVKGPTWVGALWPNWRSWRLSVLYDCPEAVFQTRVRKKCASKCEKAGFSNDAAVIPAKDIFSKVLTHKGWIQMHGTVFRYLF